MGAQIRAKLDLLLKLEPAQNETNTFEILTL